MNDKSDNLPPVVALCPDPGHTQEFYVPHGGRCPADDCERELVVYVPQAEVERLRVALEAVLAVSDPLPPDGVDVHVAAQRLLDA